MKRIILLSSVLLGVLIFFNSCEQKTIDPIPVEGDVVNITEVKTNTTWTTGNVYIIDGTLSIEGVTLTIEPGTIVKFKDGAEINVGNSEEGSALIANGTAEKPILFTSYATSPTKGDWDGIYFYSGTASTSSMKFCTVEYAGGYSSYGSINMNECEITIENSIIRLSKTWGITLNSSASFKSFVNNTIETTENHVISIYPNAVHTIGLGNIFTPMSGLGINIKAGTFNHTDETWLAHNAPYIVNGTVSIKRNTGSILRIQEGTSLAFSSGAEFNVGYGEYGTLIAKGTIDKPINFTSSAISQDKGDWDGIYIYGDANDCNFEFCNFEYGGGYSSYGMINISDANVSFKNCSFKNSLTWGITLNSGAAFSSFTNNTFSNNLKYQISIYGNYVHTIGTGNVFDSHLGVYVKADDINQAGTVTWLKLDVPYYIQGTIRVGSTSGTILNIQEGTTLKFTSGAEFNIGYSKAGKIIANGTAANPITFTTANISPAQGDWDGIFLYDDTMSGTSFNHCVFSYGGGYSSYGMIHLSDCGNEVSISNSSITDSKTWGISKGSQTAIPSLTNIYYNNNLSGNTSW